MKNFIYIIFLTLFSCTKNITTTQESIIKNPYAEITKVYKSFAGSTPSLTIIYNINSIEDVRYIKLNNKFDIIVKEGQGVVRDPSAGFTNSYYYFWYIEKKDGSKIITEIKQFFY